MLKDRTFRTDRTTAGPVREKSKRRHVVDHFLAMPIPHFPVRLSSIGKHTAVDTLVDYAKEKDKPELYSLFRAATNDALGSFSKGQFLTQKDVDDVLSLGSNLCFKDVNQGGRVFFFINSYPSPLCRSNAPVVHAGYSLLDTEYRGKRLMAHLGVFHLHLGIMDGYHGSLSRVGASATGGYYSSKLSDGFSYIGIIPDGVYHGNDFWADDLIAHLDYYKEVPDLQKILLERGVALKIRRAVADIPPLKSKDMEILCQPADISFDAERYGTIHELFGVDREAIISEKHVYLELAGPGAIEVEEMIRAAAQDGEGFALDEFDRDGLLNRRLLRQQTVTLVARRKSDHVLIGGAVMGPSSLSRARRPCSLGGYIVVEKRFRRQGYGTEIVTMCEQVAQELGYKNITTDLLYSPKTQGALQLAINQGYVVTGQLPKCAFLKDLGLTSSFILYKRLNKQKQMAKL